MKLYDSLTYMLSQRPVWAKNHISFDEFLIAEARDGESPNKGIAQRLLDAEELFLPQDERPLSQLQNPRYQLQQTDLPDGITGILWDGETRWETDSSAPFTMDAIYIRSKL